MKFIRRMRKTALSIYIDEKNFGVTNYLKQNKKVADKPEQYKFYKKTWHEKLKQSQLKEAYSIY